ncbi:MAG: DUF3313 family protein [Parahaliea sp.]
MWKFQKLMASLIATVLMLVLSACAQTGSTLQVETFDGLLQTPSTRFSKVYIKPGVDLSVYQRYALAECRVAFRRNWLRDQNQSRLDLNNRVTQEDVNRIKDRLSEDCEAHFRQALEVEPAYTLVEEAARGQPVLLLQPSIINLDINAPDVRSAGHGRSYTTSTGEMTLSLDLSDATTGEVLARVVDRRRDPQDSYMSWTNSVTNKAEADRVLKRWGDNLRKALDELKVH